MSFPTSSPDPDDERTTAAAARDAEADLIEDVIEDVIEAEQDEAIAAAAEALADQDLEQAAERLIVAEEVEGLAVLAEVAGNTDAAEGLREIEEELIEEAEELAAEADELNELAEVAHEAAKEAADEAVELATEAIVLDEVASEAEESAAEGELESEIVAEVAELEADFEAEAEAVVEAEVEALEEAVLEEAAEEAIADAVAEEIIEEAIAEAIVDEAVAEVLDEDALLEEGAAEPEVERPISPYDRPGRWFVVHTQSGYEKKVKQNLEARISSMNMEGRIFEVVIPMEDVVEFKGGKKVVVQKKMFPGYLLVRCMMDDDSWYVIRNTPGVTGFVGQGAKPSPLPRKDVESFLQVKTEDEEGEPTRRKGPRLEYEMNETVRIKEGPFADFSGQITEINEDQLKVKVEVDIFGRPTPVELEFSQIAKL